MTAAIDIRAKMYCSLGPVISGSLSDSYVQGTGLIYTKGSIEIATVMTPEFGQKVKIGYIKNNRIILLPRCMFVLSFFADPFRRQTTLSLGCKLTLISEQVFPETVIYSQQSFPGVSCQDFNKTVLGIRAFDIISAIINLIGTGAPPLLKNHFAIPEFTIPSKPLSTLSDLLVSENHIGYADADGELVCLQFSFSNGPVINVSNIIDISPINSGDRPGDNVIVKYSTTQLTAPPENEEDEDRAKRNWEWEEVFGPLQDVSISYYPDDDELEIKRTVQAYYKPYTFTATTYDQWDRAVQRMTYELSVLAETNNRYAVDSVKYGTFSSPEGAAQPLVRLTPKVSFTYWDYKISPKGGTSDIDLFDTVYSDGVVSIGAVKSALSAAADAEQDKTALECLEEKGDDPDDLSVVTQERTITYICEAELAGTLNIDSYTYNPGESLGADLTTAISLDTDVANILESDTKIKFSKDEASGYTQTLTSQRLIYGKTTTGQQDLATMLKEAQENEAPNELSVWLVPILLKAQELRSYGVETRIRTEREYGLQKRPSQADRNKSQYEKKPLDLPTETVQRFTGEYGDNTVEFQLPYADDPRIVLAEGGGYTAVPGKAEETAKAFGELQNRLLLGNRYGVSAQIPADLMPPKPCSGLGIVSRGLTIYYITNGTTYTFDGNGIIASSDLLGLGFPLT